MTEQSSCKHSFFGKYLLYRIGTLKGNLLISIVLNLLGLPFFALGHLHISSAQLNGTAANENFFLYASFFGNACVYAMVLLAVTGAAASFTYYNKKELTDTLGVLPLTNGERFWGDFLGGYIANVAPFIPGALIAAVMFTVTHNNYSIIAARTGGVLEEDHLLFIFGLSLSLLFIYTFAYVISTLITSIFGRFMFAEIFSVLGVVAFSVTIMGISGTFVNEIIGVASESEINRVNAYAMPFGLLFSEVSGSLSKIGAFNAMAGGKMEFFTDFMILEPVNIVIFTVSAAGLTILAYFAAKFRKQERVGKTVVNRIAFCVMELISAGGAVMFVISLDKTEVFSRKFTVGALISVIIIIIFEVIRRPRIKELATVVLGYAFTLSCCFGMCMLFKGTGAFGQRYINAAPEKIEYIEVGVNFKDNDRSYDGSYKLTEKSDILQFTEKHNSLLSVYSDRLNSGTEFTVGYKLTDGRTINRCYSGYNVPILEMINNLYSLDGYPEALCGLMNDSSKITSCAAVMEDVFGTIYVPSDKLSEFLGVFSSDISENFSADAGKCGSVSAELIDAESSHSVNISIQNNFTKTIEYLKALDSNDKDNGNALALSLERRDYYGGTDYCLRVCIYKKDLNDELVAELFSLLKQRSDFGSIVPDDLSGLVTKTISVTSTNSVTYYVPLSEEKRVSEIMLELAKRALQ